MRSLENTQKHQQSSQIWMSATEREPTTSQHWPERPSTPQADKKHLFVSPVPLPCLHTERRNAQELVSTSAL